MFSPEDRARLRQEILDRASSDAAIVAAALTGSAAEGKEDRWSDIDLALAVSDAGQVQAVLASWTGWMYENHAALHHYDLAFGPWLYRAFLLPGTLQVDLAFVPASEFRPLAPTFRLIFGEAREAQNIPAPESNSLIGLGWLYALHASSAIGRQRVWQAEYMISGIRNTTIALACVRSVLPSVHARGADRLPADLLAGFASTLVRDLTAAELSRAFRAALAAFVAELRRADAPLADRLEPALGALAFPESEHEASADLSH